MLLRDAGILYFCVNRAPRDRDTSLCLIGRRYEHVDKYFNDV